MVAYVIRRLFSGLIMLLMVTLVTFVLFFAAGKDPAKQTCGKNCSPQLIEQNRKALGYDKPVINQWADFVKGTVSGREFPADEELKRKAPETIAKCDAPCLGYSPLASMSVTDEIKQAFPVSLSIAVVSFAMTLIMGVGFGILAALTRGGIVDKILVGSALLFYSLPTFAIGLLLYQFVALKWGIVPVPEYQSIADGGIGGWLQGLFLPALTLALFTAAGYVRMTRAYVLETMSEDYLRTAKAKGLSKSKTLWKHTMRAAITPIMTMAGIDFALLVGGAPITETVFNYDGLGKLAVTSASASPDLPTTVGIVVVLSALVIVANIIVDCLYAVVDPRVKLA